jgi:hypothetical protein
MTERNLHTFLSAATSASASATYKLDYRFDEAPTRTLMGTLTAGAHLNVFGALDPTGNGVEHLISVVSASSFMMVIEAPLGRLRLEKVGASGTATVQGLV